MKLLCTLTVMALKNMAISGDFNLSLIGGKTVFECKYIPTGSRPELRSSCYKWQIFIISNLWWWTIVFMNDGMKWIVIKNVKPIQFHLLEKF